VKPVVPDGQFLGCFHSGAASAFAVVLIRTDGWIDRPFFSMKFFTEKCEQTLSVLLHFSRPKQTVDARE
jgi:hypothetical protein